MNGRGWLGVHTGLQSPPCSHFGPIARKWGEMFPNSDLSEVSAKTQHPAGSVVQTAFQIAFCGVGTIVNARKTHQKFSQMLQNGRHGPSGPMPTILQHLRAFFMGFTTINDRSDFPKSDLKISLDATTGEWRGKEEP